MPSGIQLYLIAETFLRLSFVFYLPAFDLHRYLNTREIFENMYIHSDNFILLGFVKINIISYWEEIWNGFDDGEAICSIDVYPFLAFSTWKRILYLLFSHHHGCKHYFLLHVHCEKYPGMPCHISHLYVLLDVWYFPP